MAAGGVDQAAPQVFELDQRDAEQLERAFETISRSLRDDCVTRYLAQPGSEQEFPRAVCRSYVAGGEPQVVLQAADFGCCALLGVVRRQGDGQQAELQPGSAAAEAEAGVLAHLRPDRREALERLQAQPVLDRLVEEHGSALCIHFLGAHPDRQGQGLGSVLLRRIGALADHQGRHAYLEASTARSRNLYERHSFVHQACKPLGDEGGAPVLAAMVRPPSAAATASAADAAAS